MLRVHVVSECNKWIIWILFILFAFPISDRVQYIFVSNETKSNKLKRHNNLLTLTNSPCVWIINKFHNTSIHKHTHNPFLHPSGLILKFTIWTNGKQSKQNENEKLLSSHAEIHNEYIFRTFLLLIAREEN